MELTDALILFNQKCEINFSNIGPSTPMSFLTHDRLTSPCSDSLTSDVRIATTVVNRLSYKIFQMERAKILSFYSKHWQSSTNSSPRLSRPHYFGGKYSGHAADCGVRKPTVGKNQNGWEEGSQTTKKQRKEF